LENYLPHLVEAGDVARPTSALDREWFIRRRAVGGEGAFVADADYLATSLKRLATTASSERAAEIALSRLQVAFLSLSVSGRFYWLGPEYIEARAATGSERDVLHLCAAIE